MRYLFILVFLAIGFATAKAEQPDFCKNWFKALKLQPGTSDCELKCSMTENDMGDFDCPSRCEEFCGKPRLKCSLDKYWLDKLAAPSKPFPPFNNAKLEVLRSIFAELPTGFKPKNLKAVVGASGNPEPLSAFSPASSSEEYIILFPKAFTDLEILKRVLAHEVVHFLSRAEWRKYFEKYKSISGWTNVSKNVRHRKGAFVEVDGQFSPEEDFANNIEYFMFDQTKLKTINPEIFAWIQKNLAKFLILRSCSNAK